MATFSVVRLGIVNVIGLATVVGATGCASPHRDAVSSVAVSFVSAVEQGDGAKACGILTMDAEKGASGATQVECAAAITQLDENGTAVSGTQVWGDAAQVRVGSDTLFLRRISGRWQVSSAGCEVQPKGPYECKVVG